MVRKSIFGKFPVMAQLNVLHVTALPKKKKCFTASSQQMKSKQKMNNI